MLESDTQAPQRANERSVTWGHDDANLAMPSALSLVQPDNTRMSSAEKRPIDVKATVWI